MKKAEKITLKDVAAKEAVVLGAEEMKNICGGSGGYEIEDYLKFCGNQTRNSLYTCVVGSGGLIAEICAADMTEAKIQALNHPQCESWLGYSNMNCTMVFQNPGMVSGADI